MVVWIIAYKSKSLCPTARPDASGILISGEYRSALDFNPINTIASHMSYWGDEDVNHFVLSQLLSGQPVEKKSGI